ncbi:LysR family transcriptional regulator [Sulfitobacter sp. SK012]|uniref:LysR family transcriptional regulator n=1 Tax=Sulfitobacter sp. SK012 TaxID=1389005 RepID=UPI000E0B2B7D|nr:LysR family transcriptional regulator [Sulfitobacter sp. SK012]AXI48335.1 LysR family transcriptional regulator [Sulfitobacter sp. SK012]
MSNLSLSNIPLDWVRAFELAGRTGSFTAAAKESNVTQASISQRISNLERRIGVRLFVRNPRGVTLSVEGEAWLPYVSAAFRNLDESYEDLFGIQREKITIFASASVNELWLAPRLRNWQSTHKPQIVLSTMVLQPDDSLLDTTIRVQYGRGEGKDLHKIPLFAEHLSPVVAPQLLATHASWLELPRLGLSGPRHGWHEWARQTGDPITPIPRLRFDSFSAALSAAVSGAGVLLASLPLAAPLLEQGKLVRASEFVMEPQETYWMIAHKDGLTKSQWDNVVDCLFAAEGSR